MLLDIFKNDAFHFTQLTLAMEKLPRVPTTLGDMRIFNERGIFTTKVAIESRNGVLSLVPTAARGAPGPAKNPERRNIRDFNVVNLPQRVSVMADEVMGLRSFGTETDVKTAMSLLNDKMTIARRDTDITHEWHRMGALRGNILDADGTSVIYNLFTEFGVSQVSFNFALDDDNTVVRRKVVEALRAIRDKLGGTPMTRVEWLCSPEFFDEFVDHPSVVKTYEQQQGAMLRADLRGGFEFAGCVWRECDDSIGATRFIPAGQAVPVPIGVPGLFETYFAPGPYMDAVGTQGIPFYVRPKEMDFNVGVEWQTLSCPLHLCTRPDAILKAGMNAASIA